MLKIVLIVLTLWSAATASAQELILGVSEGTSGSADHVQVVNKYKGLADVMGRSIGRPVSVVFVREFAALEEGMKASRFDFVFARPSDYPARGVKSYGYQFLASAKPDGHCYLITRQDSPLKTLADLRGKRIVLPQAVAYMAKFCQAELRSQGIDLAKEKVQYVREQGLVALYLENKFADVGGIASYSGEARKLEQAGFTILHKSVAQPYFPLIAASRVTPSQREAIRKALAEIASAPTGPAVLKSIEIDGFDLNSEDRLRALLDWLGA